jgi:hypothetical protein
LHESFPNDVWLASVSGNCTLVASSWRPAHANIALIRGIGAHLLDRSHYSKLAVTNEVLHLWSYICQLLQFLQYRYVEFLLLAGQQRVSHRSTMTVYLRACNQTVWAALTNPPSDQEQPTSTVTINTCLYTFSAQSNVLSHPYTWFRLISSNWGSVVKSKIFSSLLPTLSRIYLSRRNKVNTQLVYPIVLVAMHVQFLQLFWYLVQIGKGSNLWPRESLCAACALNDTHLKRSIHLQLFNLRLHTQTRLSGIFRSKLRGTSCIAWPIISSVDKLRFSKVIRLISLRTLSSCKKAPCRLLRRIY